ncbi:hypothetical protein [Streptomyces bicolor]|uniref:hypothetical protein n=1 Tax=Streptomyces bicolor TaxID=66874 RepID=UPI0004E1A1E8|nr:hypothetical protein [Streptomyces bicolor]
MRPVLLCGLGNALSQADPEDVQARHKSADRFREALGLLPPGKPVVPLVHSGLVATLLPTEIPPDGMPADVVAEAVRHAEEAVRLTTAADPDHGHRLNHLFQVRTCAEPRSHRAGLRVRRPR